MEKAIIFDLEGVVVDSQKLWDTNDAIFLSRRGYTVDAHILKPQMMGTNLVEGVEIMRRLYPFEGDAKTLADERRQIFEELLRTGVHFIPGFLEFFQKIKAEYATAVASSLERKFLKAVDETVGLTTLFGRHIYSIEDIGFISKPNPDIFLYAARQLGINPPSCIVVEDSPHGLTAAKRAGMRSIGILTSTTRENLAHADLVINGYSDINFSLPLFRELPTVTIETA